ncbi:MAG: hypothetical protein NC081_02730 [Roseburia sp.]|nr:hypothetical protein [Roseburia sp.]
MEMKKYISAALVILLLVGFMPHTPVAYATAVVGEGTCVDYWEGSISGNDAIRTRQQDVVSLQVPQNLDFLMDPYGMINDTQIHSDRYCFRNTGDTAVRLSLTNIVCELAQGVAVAPAEISEEDIRESEDKLIRLQLYFEDGSFITVSQDPGVYELVLEAGESAEFSIGGCMSVGAKDVWEDGDAGISMIYDVKRVNEEFGQESENKLENNSEYILSY